MARGQSPWPFRRVTLQASWYKPEHIVIEYRECLIITPHDGFDSSTWSVNVASIDWTLQSKIGPTDVVIDDDQSLDNAIAKAKAFVDSLH